MSTPTQEIANLANAQLSTGPRTASGKSRASLNALRHGLASNVAVLPGEDATLFATFVKGFHRDLAPAGHLEISLVDALAKTQWMMDRIRTHEINLFALGHEAHADSIPSGDPAIQAALAGAVILREEADLLKNTRLYMQRNQRLFDASFKQLLALQSERKAAELKEVEAAAAVATSRKTLNQPFLPEDFGFVCPELKIEHYVRRSEALAAPKQLPQSSFAILDFAAQAKMHRKLG